MYYQVASKLALTAGTGSEGYSQAVSMAGGNAVQVEFTVFNLGGATNITVHVEESNDLENWELNTSANSGAITAVQFKTFKVSDIASQYVRLKYVGTGTGNIIVGAGVNVANL